MDPLSALGLASNVVQFVDFVSKLISESIDIYRSASGTSAENVELGLIYTNLSDLTKSLTVPSLTQGHTLSVEERSLRHLASSCHGVATELLDTIHALRVDESTTHRRWQSFRQALKTVWKKSRIDDLQSRLNGFREQLTLTLVAILGDRQSSVLRGIESLSTENKRLNTDQALKIDYLNESFKSLRHLLQDHANIAITRLDLEDLHNRLSEMNNLATVLALQQRVLKSLRFKTMSTRRSKISEAHADTFNWIFDKDNYVNFQEWLLRGSNAYWISGKPGSGKSTLMKFIYDHGETKRALSDWAANKKLVVASFFFWSVGTPMQKSQEGLLRSLLFEIVKACPDLISGACPLRWSSNSEALDDWDLDELGETIRQVFQRANKSTNFCFFIDGLDEYDGRHGDVIRILNDMVKHPACNVKMCISSRPWNVFEDAFGTDPRCKLYLEDLTRDDIEHYVCSTLENHGSFAMFSLQNNGYEDLILEIVTKAEGVFLWVFLVVRSVCDALTAGEDDITLLCDRVRRLPTDLEEYFRAIIESVEYEYKHRMAQAFQVTLYATEPLPLLAYSFLDQSDPDFCINQPVRSFDRDNIYERHLKTKRRINGRYKGLLQVTSDPSARDYFAYRVEYFHRTVHDFMRLKDIQALLQSYLKGAKHVFNAHVSLCKIYLSIIKSMPMDRDALVHAGYFQDILDLFIVHAREAEQDNNDILHDIIDELADTVLHLSETNGDCHIHWGVQGDHRHSQCKTFLEFSVSSGLISYVVDILKNEPHLIDRPSQPLLACTLRFSPSLRSLESESLKMVRFLLENGADPNQSYGPSTIFGEYLLAITGKNTSVPLLSTKVDVVRQRLEILELLLSHNANVNVAVPGYVGRVSDPPVAAWGRLLMGMVRLNAPRKVCSAHFDILKLLLRYGADVNLRYSSPFAASETIWEAFLRLIQAPSSNGISESRIRLRFEMAKTLLLNGADLNVYLDVPGIRYLTLSEVFSKAFNVENQKALEDIVTLERSRRGLRRYCFPNLSRWIWYCQTVLDPIWGAIRFTRPSPTPPNGYRVSEDAADDHDLFPRIGGPATSSVKIDSHVHEVSRCRISLKNAHYYLRVPELSVFFSHQSIKNSRAATITIEVRHDDSLLGLVMFDAINLERIEAHVEKEPIQRSSTEQSLDAHTDSLPSERPSPSPRSGRVLLCIRSGSKPSLHLHKPRFRPSREVEQMPWLLSRLRSNGPHELLEALEVLLVAASEAREILLQLNLKHDASYKAFEVFASATDVTPQGLDNHSG